MHTPVAGNLLEVRDLRVHFPIRTGLLQRTTGWHRAVDGVSFDLGHAETLGLVGESGCGKTTAGRAIMRLIAKTDGRVTFEGHDVHAARGAALMKIRRRMQIIFQDPGGSMNPRLRVGDIVGEPLVVHRIVRDKHELRKRVSEMIERCGMPASCVDRYPHEFSGGQKQRLAIARALVLHPKLIVCDEPTSALDVSVQAQILNLLRELQRDMGLSYLFISHDMGVIEHMCDRIAVMKAGQIVELGPRAQIIDRPQHEYTRQLLAAVPGLEPRKPATRDREHQTQ
jgi:oligopeptide transport system ATP-binding protein